MCLRRGIRFRGEHHAGGAAQAREQARGFGQHRFDRFRLAGRRDLRLDRLAVVLGEIADLHQRIDEEAQPHFGRQPPGRSVRRIDQPELFEIGHDVAHRSRRQGHRQDARQIARADRLAGREIALDDLAKNLARTLVELGEAQLVHAQRKVMAGQDAKPRRYRASIYHSAAAIARARGAPRSNSMSLRTEPKSSSRSIAFT